MVSVIFVCKHVYLFFCTLAHTIKSKEIQIKTVWYHPRLTRSCSVVLAVIVTWAVFHKSDRFAHWSASGQKADEKRSSSCKRNCQQGIKENLLPIVKGEKEVIQERQKSISFFFLSQVLSRQHFVFETFLEDFEIVA